MNIKAVDVQYEQGIIVEGGSCAVAGVLQRKNNLDLLGLRVKYLNPHTPVGFKVWIIAQHDHFLQWL
ncbi:uncharacterized protein BKA55DRAFT_572126 [Fusarium redolens]|uniref:Uncharacterized protein n=1 Tax=Fusarium redolens TaxID=48865 RepID=A0A9P9K4B7_FUSRE|nr:uncharacterized protein BKA55DRAFT_572126 [Fusarium redolens]KAH7247513.1 hypothetical protein BKA55DRAFT_572126 [Fusarium redolens]